jgi:fibronectin type 3 domain-containing protein
VSANFSQSNNCGSSLNAGAQCSIIVLFDPTEAGSVSGSVAITDSASTGPQTVALTGTATASATHSVSVSWTPSTSSNVVGYNVYRSTTSGGYYSELNSAALTGTSYSDNTVSAAATYYYVATAINSSGEQSSYSSQATAVVP